MPKTPLSILDLAPVPEGATAGDALRRSRDLAAHAESWGYKRFWLAEHHNMVGIASAATSVAIGYVLEGTERIRVGAGGIMLPNHAPLVIAEQFGTLESLFPGRVDLGLGRAPGTDGLTLRALRRSPEAAEDFPRDVLELQALFAEPGPEQRVRAVPGAGLKVPLWILGSSLFGAQLAAMLGLPFAFASHFAPGRPEAGAHDLPRPVRAFRATGPALCDGRLQRDRGGDGGRGAGGCSPRRSRASSISCAGRAGGSSPPIDDIEAYWTPPEKAHVSRMLACSFVGAGAQVADRLHGFLAETGADELIVAAAIYDHDARLRSYQILAEAMG